MNDLKTYVVAGFGGLFSLLAPIQNFMYAMILLFSLNFLFGFLADKLNGGKWSTKKALMFFVCCAVFFVTACCAFIVGHLMGEMGQAISVVKYLCVVAIFVFGTNIFRNLRKIPPKGTAWYRFFDLCYFILSAEFIEKIPFIKKWQEERNGKDEKKKTVLGKDNN